MGPFRVQARTADGDGDRSSRRAHVVDASGQQALLGRRDGLREFNPFFKNLAIWSYFADAARMEGPLRDNILSAAHGEGWCWYIPLHDGTISVGAVVDAARWKERARPDGACRRPIRAPDRRLRARGARCYAARARSLRFGSSATTRTRALASFTARPCSPATPPASSIPCFRPASTWRASRACSRPTPSRTRSRAGATRATALADYDASLSARLRALPALRHVLLQPPRRPRLVLLAGTQARRFRRRARAPRGVRTAHRRHGRHSRRARRTSAKPTSAGRRAWPRSEARSAPGMHLMRVAATLAEMRRIAAHSS